MLSESWLPAIEWQTCPRLSLRSHVGPPKCQQRPWHVELAILAPVWGARRALGRSATRISKRVRRQAVRETVRVRPSIRSGCASWGCTCQNDHCPEDLESLQLALLVWRKLLAWTRSRGQKAPKLYKAASPDGYRTRAKLAVGPTTDGKTVIGLFRKGTFEVARCHGCRANHPLLDAALATLEEALELPKVQPFDHKDPASTEPSLRHVELTLEGSTGRVQLVLLWNGQRGSFAPGLDELIENLWPSDIPSSDQWHSILVHWRAPDPSLAREMRSKRKNAWEQRRPKSRRGKVQATMIEKLDGLPFAFGAKSFRQANLIVYEEILRDMKAQLKIALGSLQAEAPLRLLELCGGVGVIGLSLAHAAAAQGTKVTLLSTDSNPESGELFKVNTAAIFDNQKLVQATFSALSADAALQRGVSALGGPAEVLILDPPRRGLACQSWRSGLPAGQEEVEQIRQSSVRVIVYMSCGPRSFMQDANRLTGPGTTPAFELSWMRCYDMFPFTEHVETLGIFLRREAGGECFAPNKKLSWKSWEETSLCSGRPVQPERGRWQCQFLVGIEADQDFGVVGRLLGRRGANMKRIAGDTNAKMRLRGRGSGFKEADLGGKESSDPLMLCAIEQHWRRECSRRRGLQSTKHLSLLVEIHHPSKFMKVHETSNMVEKTSEEDTQSLILHIVALRYSANKIQPQCLLAICSKKANSLTQYLSGGFCQFKICSMMLFGSKLYAHVRAGQES
eukprot:s1204_g5.t2